jgi:hypothetical protein
VSRSGYSDDIDNWAMIKWRGQVASSIRGKRGQAFLRELLTALDAMPEKRLVAHEFEAEGQFCTLGVVAHARGLELKSLDPEDSEIGDEIGKMLGITGQLAREIMFENDDYYSWSDITGRLPDSPEKRWRYMREWVVNHIRADSK